MPETLKSRINRGDKLHVFALSRMLHHNLVQMIGFHGGFDGFWIDGEHAGPTTRDIEVAAMAGRACGMHSFIRIPPTDYASVTRCLESGVEGVMGAQIRDVAHAREFLGWARYSPSGTRGMNTGGYDGHFGLLSPAELGEAANRDAFVAIQIETLTALDDCDAIAALDGVDLLFVGPVDLSLALGVPGQFLHPKCLEAVDAVSKACRRHGKHWGAVTPSPEHAAMAAEKGCTMLSVTNDVRLVNAGIKAVKGAFGV